MGLFGQDDPEAVEVAGRQLECRVCGHTEFWHRRAQLNTAVMSFFDFDWANATADCQVCARCGYVHWFLLP